MGQPISIWLLRPKQIQPRQKVRETSKVSNIHMLCLSTESFDILLEQENRYSLEQMVSYRHGRHVADKTLPRHVR